MLDTERSRPESATAPRPETGQAAGEDIRIATGDGRQLAATLFAPSGAVGGASPEAPVTIIAGGTGIPRRYYARFAAWLAERGRLVITFDYRDTGGSRSGSLKGSQVRMRDWCALDVPAILAWAANAHPGRPLHWVGHSLGGFAVGLAHNNHLIARQLNVGTLSGYWRHMAVPERYRVRLLMGMVAPLIIRARGYFPGVYPGRRGHAGAGLPGVAPLVPLARLPVRRPHAPGGRQLPPPPRPCPLRPGRGRPTGAHPPQSRPLPLTSPAAPTARSGPSASPTRAPGVSATTASSAPSTATPCGARRPSGSTADRGPSPRHFGQRCSAYGVWIARDRLTVGPAPRSRACPVSMAANSVWIAAMLLYRRIRTKLA